MYSFPKQTGVRTVRPTIIVKSLFYHRIFFLKMTLGFSSGRAAVSGEKDGPAGRFVIATQDLDLGTQVKS